jgi:hypothetical protein
VVPRPLLLVPAAVAATSRRLLRAAEQGLARVRCCACGNLPAAVVLALVQQVLVS